MEEQPLIINHVSPLGQAASLGLKAGDIILAKDGISLAMSPPEFNVALYKEGAVLSVGRGGKIFDVKVQKGLGLNVGEAEVSPAVKLLKTALEERGALDLSESLDNWHILNSYEELTVLKNSDNIMSAICPAVWLLLEGLILQAVAIIFLYVLSFVVHPFVFAGVYLIVSLYFYRHQIQTLLTDKFLKGYQPVLVIAASSRDEAMNIANGLFGDSEDGLTEEPNNDSSSVND
ncbi:MAG: hypothetical protein CMM25_07810 [Rhodospirillaceae bacterium]|nr:hypothetical protein [Rhodospirillaceae bacterium]